MFWDKAAGVYDIFVNVINRKIGTAVLAAALTYIVKFSKASVTAFGYAFFSYLLAVLGGKLFGKTSFIFDPIKFLIVIAVTGVLSFLGVVAGTYVAKKKRIQ